MIQTGFESRVKVQDIIENQIPSFILNESPNASTFLEQYYISQEYQGGPSDISENLDQYLKVDNLTPEVVVDSTLVTSGISSTDTTIYVSSTKGFPNKYGLLKINDEIITYSGVSTNTFTGCIRGFSGISSYHQDLNQEELVFSTSSVSSHLSNTSVQNLSSLFLKEFYKKLKKTFTPGLEDSVFVSEIDAGNFIKEARTFYEAKGTDESFRILFNVLYGVTPKIINLEDYLIKPSSSDYGRREVIVADVISGNPLNLVGQTIQKKSDTSISAVISEVEPFTRNNKQYFKISLFIGYGDETTIEGDFVVTPNTKCLETAGSGSSVLTVDSTIGFGVTGTIFSGTNEITYTSKSINQFFGCSGIVNTINSTDNILSDQTYFGYEDGDTSKKVELIITGSISDFIQISENLKVDEGDNIFVDSIGEVIKNPTANKTYKELFANSWIYNVRSSFGIGKSVGSNAFDVTTPIDRASLKKGDQVEILKRGSNVVELTAFVNNIVGEYRVEISGEFPIGVGTEYVFRRKLRTPSSDGTPLESNKLFSDIQNVYNENNEFMYVASNSLPSEEPDPTETENPYSYKIPTTVQTASVIELANSLSDKVTYTEIKLGSVPFFTGEEITYQPAGTPIIGLGTGNYFVEKVSNSNIRLYSSRSFIGGSDYITLKEPSGGVNVNDTFTLRSQNSNLIGPQKLLKKFPLSVNTKDSKNEPTVPGGIGMLINGVEISNYKSVDNVYYGPLDSIKVLNSGSGYDVINLPKITVSNGLGVTALIQPVISGSFERVSADSQEFDIDKVVSIGVSGGNGSGAVFEASLAKRFRNIFFDARTTVSGGGINTVRETLTFLSDHSFDDGQEIIYNNQGNVSLGIGTLESSTETLINNGSYFVEVLNNRAIKLFNTKSDSLSGINTVGFTTSNKSGIHKFIPAKPKTGIEDIKIINGGSGYTNRKLIVKPSGISTNFDTVYFKDHNFSNGDLVEYTFETTTITGLSSSNQYYVLKVDDDYFKLSDAGIGGTITSNFETKKYVDLTSQGEGYQYFKYPDISVNLTFTPVGVGTTTQNQTVTLTPTVRGSIIDSYLYESGTGYGSSIINFEKKPIVSIKTGVNAELVPNIVNGTIDSVRIEYGGKEYYSEPDLIVSDSSSSGSGAKLRAVISNGRISEVKVLTTGIGYSSSSTSIQVKSAGSNALFDSSVRQLTINNVVRFGNELLTPTTNNLKYSVAGYSTSYFEESGHSPIIGWAYDGNPIYGPYGYSNAGFSTNPVLLTSGYTLDISNIIDRPSVSDFDGGFFVEDYKFTGSGDLDQYNGRFTKTPEFKDGVYAYFALIDSNENSIFPYFIGNNYKSNYVGDNLLLDQEFDFTNSDLIRNTFPYNINDEKSDYDFVYETSELSNQIVEIESVTDGTITGFDILNSGSNYKVNDTLKFDGDGGLSAVVSSIKGKDIVDVNTTVLSYNNSIFTWNNSREVEVTILPNHDLVNGDTVSISGLSTYSKLNNTFNIGISSYTANLQTNILSASSIGTTEISVSNVPPVSVGSSIGIGTETLSILNIYRKDKILTVKRGLTNVGHSTGSSIIFTPDSFTIPVEMDYFDSRVNSKVYFNPTNSVGYGTEVGVSTSVTFNFGITTTTRDILSQSIFIPNHPFSDNQKLFITNPGAVLSVSTTSDGSTFSLPTTVYATSKGKDIIGIKTGIGVSFSELFFRGGGSDNDEYLFESDFEQVTGNVKRQKTTVSVSTAHELSNGDVVNLTLQPSLNVGIGTSTGVRLKVNSSNQKLVVNSIGFNSTGINTSTDTFNINSHNFKTGDKVSYSSDLLPLGLNNSEYYIYKVDDNNFKLAETYYNSVLSSPSIIGIGSTGGATQTIELINSQIKVIRGNNLVFDISDSSLSGYNLKIYTDKEFGNEFVSTGSTTNFNVVSTGSSVTINYSENLPTKLYYNLEKSGYISTADTDVKNYNEILYVDSVYTNDYKISGVGNTTFDVVLSRNPERDSYTKEECDIIKYDTSSTSEKGGISKIKIISSGSGYKKLPILTGSGTTVGQDAYIVSKSNTIGDINQIRVINEGFQYPSDSTLQPSAYISPLVTLSDSNTIGIVSVTSGGKGYTEPPSIIIVNPTTKKIIDSGLLESELTGSSISSVKVVSEPKGLPASEVELYSTNNTNGVSILKVESNNTGIFTCVITTPTLADAFRPFSDGDKVFIEGIVGYSTDGSGFNSADYDYKFLTVSGIITSSIPHKVTINVSGLTTNTGIAKTVQDSLANIIKSTDYPSFGVISKATPFLEGEKLIVNGVEVDLSILKYDITSIKVKGSYELTVGDIINGKESGSKATINKIEENNGRFSIKYGNTKNIGWFDNVGKLNETTQVVPNNDYYQNLSYSVQSPIEYNVQKTPVNSLLHTSGLKNFADTGITSSKSIGIGSSDATISVQDIIGDQRVDTVYGFDFAKDSNVTNESTKFIQFKNQRLTPYTEVSRNNVFVMDDINSQFSNLADQQNPSTEVSIFEINPSFQYSTFLVRVTNASNTEIQLSDLVVIKEGDTNLLLNKGEISNIGSGLTHTSETNYGEFSIKTDEFNTTNLIFDPVDPYTQDYDIKVLQKEYIGSTVGIATTNLGTLIDITNSTQLASSGVTTNIIGVSTTKFNSLVVNSKVKDIVSNEVNFVESFVTHDGESAYIAESYYDSTGKVFSGENIGSFGANINNNVMNLEFLNDSSSNDIQINSRIVGFGTTAGFSSAGEYLFKSTGQSNPRAVQYYSNYADNKISTGFGLTVTVYGTSTIIDAAKSIVQVSVGSTRALYQVMVVKDGSDNHHIQQSQLLFTDDKNVTGIGTFGITGQMSLNYYPDSSYSSNYNEVVSYTEFLYTENDKVNIPNDLVYGNSVDSTYIKDYAGINGEIGNKKQFTLTTNNIPLFAKSFNPSDTTTLNASTGVFNIDNHFFRNNEELIYTPKSTFVGVGSTPMQYKNGSIIDTLPTSVFAIVQNDDSFQISTTKAGTAVTFVGLGEGNAHQFEMAKKNEKSLISIDNVVQYPLMFTPVNHSLSGNGGSISTTSTTFALSGISTIEANDILGIDDEYVKVINVGFGTTNTGPITGIGTTALVEVERGILGSISTSHSDTTGIATIYKGSYNIVGSDIFFVDAPRGDANQDKNIMNLNPPTSEFAGRSYFRNNYDTNQIYDDISDQFTGIGRTFTIRVGGANTAAGIGTTSVESQNQNALMFINGVFQTPSTLNNPSNNFEIITDATSGVSTVIFSGITDSDSSDIISSESDINQNNVPRGGIIISLGSTGGLGYAPLVGASVTSHIGAGGSFISAGIGTTDIHGSGYYGTVAVGVTDFIYDHRFVSSGVNSITDNNGTKYTATNATYDSPTGILVLTIANHGLTDSNTIGIDTGGIVFSCSKDHYATEHAYPRAVSKTKQRRGEVGGDPAHNQQLAIQTFTTNTISVGVGSGGGAGSGANITATVGVGGTLAFAVGAGGTEYVNPAIIVESPSYENLDVLGVSRIGIGSTTASGRGLQMSVEVGGASTTVGVGSTHFEVKSFKITRPGYEFKKGDKFTLVGLVTDGRISEPLEEFTLEVLDTYSDSFALWQFGELDYIDNIKLYQDGRTNFPLLYNGSPLSFEGPEGVNIEFANNLLVFVNGVLQQPNKSYTFDGGTSFDFIEAPSSDDNIDIFFYKGTEGDDTTSVEFIPKKLEKGDDLQLTGINNTLQQDRRTVFDLSFSDKVETNLYSGQGVDGTNYRSINLIKQKRDKKVNGENESKKRESIEGQIYPTARIIGDVSASDGSIFVDNASFFKEDIESGGTFDALVVSTGSTDPVSAELTATVGVGSTTISNLTIVSGGSGYTSIPTISISAPPVVGVGVGTTATATATVSSGSVNAITITNPGLGYTISPRVLVSSPPLTQKTITGFGTAVTKGFSGIVTGISTTTSGSNLAFKFHLSTSPNDFETDSIPSGTPIYIFDTRIGTGVTSMDVTGVSTVGLGTTFVDNIYHLVDTVYADGTLGIITCMIENNTSVVGLASTGSELNPVGRFSWGKLSGGSITAGISIGVTGLTIDAGLSSFPTIQRRGGGIGYRQTGALNE
jgi:hypothetical protein